MWRYLVSILLIGSVVAIIMGMGGSNSGSGVYVYVDGKRIGTMLDGCELSEGKTFLPLPVGSAVEIRMEDYKMVFIKALAIAKFDRQGKVRVGGLYSYKWHLEIREWCVGRYAETYLKFKKGDVLKFREPIKRGYFLMATGWYEPTR